jgi:hypothetical protein
MPGSNPKSANTLGVLSILCNLPWWALVEFGSANPCLNVPVVPQLSVLALGLGVVLAIIAAIQGSRQWAFAAVLPLVSFVAGALAALKHSGFAPCGM